MCSLIIFVILNIILLICFCILLKEYEDLKSGYRFLEMEYTTHKQAFEELWRTNTKEEMGRAIENHDLKQKNKELERANKELKDVIKK